MEINQQHKELIEEIKALYAKIKLDNNYTEPTQKIEPTKKYIDEKDFRIDVDENGYVKRVFLFEE
jgi:hypothetical protein